MTRITNADQVLLLLRSHLQRAQRGQRASGRPVRGRDRTSLERVQHLARNDELPESEIERALVQGLLAHDLGEHLSNEAEFQAVLEDVLAVIRKDEASRRLLAQAVKQLTEQQE